MREYWAQSILYSCGRTLQLDIPNTTWDFNPFDLCPWVTPAKYHESCWSIVFRFMQLLLFLNLPLTSSSYSNHVQFASSAEFQFSANAKNQVKNVGLFFDVFHQFFPNLSFFLSFKGYSSWNLFSSFFSCLSMGNRQEA